MFNIASFLDKFKDLGLGERLLKEAIRTSIKEILNLDLENDSINIKNGEVIFKVSPVVKNTIYIKKNAILKKMVENGVGNINDIR
jgi:hypothetical protein